MGFARVPMRLQAETDVEAPPAISPKPLARNRRRQAKNRTQDRQLRSYRDPVPADGVAVQAFPMDIPIGMDKDTNGPEVKETIERKDKRRKRQPRQARGPDGRARDPRREGG